MDDQNWASGNGTDGEINQGRILRLRLDGDKLIETTVVAKGISHPNGLRLRNGQVYVTASKLPGFLAKATAAKMRTTDGMCVDKADNIYVADFSNNAMAKVTPAGVISVLAQNGDTGGRNGDLNEPGEPIVWNGMLVVSNFDAVIEPDKVNGKHESPATLSLLRLP